MLQWNEFPRMNVEFMDKDHEECLMLIHELLAMMDNAQTDTAAISDKLALLATHLQHHFAHEESAMEESGFPPYYVHKTEHDSVLQQLQQINREWLAGHDRVALARFIGRSLLNWLETHALMMDMVTAQHLQKFSS